MFKQLLILATFVLISSCSTIKPVVTSVNDPNTAVGSIVADCARPEIADQTANLLAGINQILADTSKVETVKQSEIAALKAGAEAALACALREGVTDIVVMIQNAAKKNAAIDGRVVAGLSTMESVIHSKGYKYVDGWTPSP